MGSGGGSAPTSHAQQVTTATTKLNALMQRSQSSQRDFV
jgi:hypothetical protein